MTTNAACSRGATLPWRLLVLLWTLLALLAPVRPASAAALVLHDRIYSPKALLPTSAVLKDAKGEYTIDDVRRLDARGAFTPLHELFGAGYVKDVYWLRLCVMLPQGADERWQLQLAPPFLDDIRVHHVRPDGTMAPVLRAGDRSTPVGASEHRLATFALQLEPGTHVFYLRVHTASSMVLLPRLLPDDQARHAWMVDYLLLGGYSGAALAIVAAAIFGALLLRQRVYVFFAVFVTASSLQWFAINGLAHQLLFGHIPLLADRLTSSLIAVSGATGAVFFAELFDYRRRHRWLFVFIMFSGCYMVLAAAAPFFGFFGSVAPGTGALILLNLVLMVRPLWLLWQEGETDVRVGVLAFLVYVTLVLLNVMSVMGFIPPTKLSLRGAQIGSVVQLFILLLAIFMHAMRAERGRKQAELAAAHALEQQERERRAREEQSYLISMMAHEIRTPVAVIDAALQSLQVLDPEPTRERAQRHDRIARAVARMNALMELALTQDRLEVANWKQDLAPLNLATLTRDVVGLIGASAESRVSIEVRDDLCDIQADERMLRYALVNLIDNALKYSPASTQVSVSIEEADRDGRRGCLWSIVDHGRGIRAGDHERIFHKYFRAADVSESPGLGLGLYLVGQIVARHGGRVRAVASPPGKGARFECWLPCSQQEARA
jgi:signal transduction histidine kinase